MYAIIKTGGKQYRVKAGDSVRVEKIDSELGTELNLDVLMIGADKNYVGESELKDGKVTCVVTHQARAPKILVFKKKRRQGYRKMQGHRQSYTELFVKMISTPDGEKSEAKLKEKKAAGETKEAKSSAKKVTTKKATSKKKATKKVATKKKTTKKKTTKKASSK